MSKWIWYSLVKKNIANNLIKKSKRRAFEKIFYNLKSEHINYLIKKQKNKCCYTNIKFKYLDINYRPSIDRINSAKGYTLENIELVIKPINIMKMEMSKDEFLNYCKLIKNPSKSKGNIDLLVQASRKKKFKSQIYKERDLFIKGEKVLCYTHGFHRDYEIRDYGKKKYLKCNKCKVVKIKKNRKNNIFLNIWRKERLNKRSKTNLEYYDLIKLYIKQKGKCAMTGIVFDYDNKPSLDRINSSLGYIKGNVQLLTYKANKFKWNFTNNNLNKYINLISKNYNL